MSGTVRGKSIIVTGAGRGIGAEIARDLARNGAQVCVADLDIASARKVATEIGGNAIAVDVDVSSRASTKAMIAAAVDAFGKLDVIFNNAGIEGKVTPITEMDEAVWHAVIGVNLTGVFLGLKYVLPVMLKQESGTVVNTASTAALFGGPGMAAYVASKHGVAGITKVSSSEVARYGVRINAICPGPVETRMMRSLEAQRNPADPEAVHTANAAGMPTGRYTYPEEVANAVMYLCSDLSSNITGTQLVIDSGRSATGGAVIAPRRNS